MQRRLFYDSTLCYKKTLKKISNVSIKTYYSCSKNHTFKMYQRIDTINGMYIISKDLILRNFSLALVEKISKEEKVWYLLMSLNVLTINIPLFAIFFVMVKRRALWTSRKNVEVNVKCYSTLLRSFLYILIYWHVHQTLQHFISFISTSINIWYC